MYCLDHHGCCLIKNGYMIIISLLFTFNIFPPPFAAHSLSFNTTQFDSGTKNILYEGDAKSLLSVIELNTVKPWRVGWATYAEPLYLWNSTTRSLADFTTHFTFFVDTHNETYGYFTEGFAFFLAPAGCHIPPNSAAGGLGLFNSTTILAESQNQIVTVEFDTRGNEEWDPVPLGPHVGINVNQISSVVSATWNFSRYNDKKVVDVWIAYNATSENLSVFWRYQEDPNLKSSFLSHQIDLRKILPEWVTIGFSASTESFPERHVITSWEFNSTLDARVTINSNNMEKRKKKKKTFLIAGGAVSFFILMLTGAAIYWLVVRKCGNHSNDDHHHVLNSVINTDLVGLAFPKRFSYQELVEATNGFAKNSRLGHGGSGQVYRGVIKDLGCMVAVKRIFAQSEHYEKVFINEVKIISRIMHKNLVQFIGWCHEQGECLLVYAYMPNGSLDTHLFGSRTTLQWEFRYKIAVGLASALHYLHEDAEQCVLHRDVKSANVLVDSDFSTKLGDFGVAKLVDRQFRTRTTGVVGTLGYMAPEYANGGRASKESDMYSFGVVALEIACGRRTYQDSDQYHWPLFKWVWQLYVAGNLLHAADERLDMNFDPRQMECLLIVGLWCTHPNNKGRPKAGQVMKVLQLEAPLPELANDMHDSDPLPQPHRHQGGSSHLSFSSSFDDATGRYGRYNNSSHQTLSGPRGKLKVGVSTV